MRIAAVLVITLASWLPGQVALAADSNARAVCIAAATRAQSLRDEHKLLAAREQLRICGQTGCPSAVLRDCVGWLSETEGNIPALILTAKDERGHDLVDVRVAVDGELVTSKLDGNAVEVDPGLHVVVFETSEGVRSEQRVLAQIGEKRVAVNAMLPSPRPAQPMEAATSLGHPPKLPHSKTNASSDQAAEGSHRGSPLRPLGFVVGGVGLAGLAAGGAFATYSLIKRDAVTCAGNDCWPAQTFNAGKTAASWATASFIAGGAAAAIGVVLLLSSPKGDSTAKGSIWLAPTASGAQLAGRF